MQRILLAFLLIGSIYTLNGKHIIGGDVFFECVSIDTINNQAVLHFEFQMYRDGRDQEGADFDGGPNSQNQGAEFGLYRRSNGSRWTYLTNTPPIVYDIRERVPPNTQPCLIAPPAIFVERAVYEFDLNIDIVDGAEYMVAYQRCCRSESISNLVSPGQFGAAFAIEFSSESLALCNNSPIYNEFPPLIVCAGFALEYDHSADDIEGDSVTYEFCVPLSAGGNNTMAPRTQCDAVIPAPSSCGPDEFRDVVFRRPLFTPTAPMGGDPAVGVDFETGLISGTPLIIGEHVLAVCASEYRDGVLLSRIRRDFQFIVSSCEKAVDARIASDRTLGEDEFEVILCGDLDVQFTNQSVREQDIQEYLWEIEVDGDLLTSGEKDPLFTLPDVGTYDAKMIINPGIPNCTDSAFITINVYPGLEADFEFDYDTCVAGPVQFEDLSFTDAQFIRERRWNFGDGNSTVGLNPSHTYSLPGRIPVQLEIEDNNGCIDTEEKNVNYFPAPATIIVEPNVFLGCEPATVNFDNLTAPINEEYDILWDFGDGSDGENRTDLSPVHVYENDGLYTVSLSVTSPIGCEVSRDFQGFIRVQDGPNANFSFGAEELTLFNSTVNISNQTTNADGYYWIVDGGEDISFDRNPSFTFRDTGIHEVTLIATSENGCTDTLTQLIDVIPLAEIFFPNAFTPDGDGRNENFIGVGNAALVNDYRLIIYDRWGMEVFRTEDPLLGWNGKLNNVGLDVPEGVYTYFVRYRVPRGEEKEDTGFATLIR